MKTLQCRNYIYFNLLILSSIISNFDPVLSQTTRREIALLNSDFINKTPKINLNLASKENFDQSRNIEIEADKQFQEENVTYAEGNVIVTFKENILKADSLVYDKLNQTLNASGNIKLILENQVFTLEKLNYDFKTQKGSFFKVKGLIKTKNLIEDLDLTSNAFEEISPTLKKINFKKVLHTPDGINNWIFYTDELKVDKNKWIAKKAIFTNDLLETNQVKFEINSLRIISKDDKLKLRSSISYLIFEDNLPIPFWFANRTLNKTGDIFDFNYKWYLGMDSVDKDGYFLGRPLKPLNISDDFVLNLDPQFFVQRFLQGYTKSFVNNGDSITSDKVKRDVYFSDYFGLDSELVGKINDWDLKVEKKLYSLDFDKFVDALRLKVNLSKEVDFLNSKWNKSFYGVYRDRIWNGSLGESEIYFGYGSKLEKLNTWDENGIQKTERLTLGLGKFKGEGLNNKNLVSSYKGSIYYSLSQKIPIVVKEPENKFVDKSFNFIFEPVKQGIFLDTKLDALYSLYKDGNHHWRFNGGTYIGENKQNEMAKISSVNEIVGIEINFMDNTVGYTLYGNGNMNDMIASTTGKFDALESEEVCIAISVRRIGWKFTILDQ